MRGWKKEKDKLEASLQTAEAVAGPKVKKKAVRKKSVQKGRRTEFLVVESMLVDHSRVAP